jgi:hypothetical protein
MRELAYFKMALLAEGRGQLRPGQPIVTNGRGVTKQSSDLGLSSRAGLSPITDAA